MIDRILTHNVRSQATGNSPEAPHAPPSSSADDPPWHPMPESQTVPLGDTATIPFLHRLPTGRRSGIARRKNSAVPRY